MSGSGVASQRNVDLPRIRQNVERVISDFATRVSELQLAVLASGDGRLLASWFAQSCNGNRVSAIVSSLLAICETAGAELKAGACSSAIVVAEHLNIVVVRIRALERPMVLATAFGTDLMLGAGLRHTADIGEKLRVAIGRNTK